MILQFILNDDVVTDFNKRHNTDLVRDIEDHFFSFKKSYDPQPEIRSAISNTIMKISTLTVEREKQIDVSTRTYVITCSEKYKDWSSITVRGGSVGVSSNTYTYVYNPDESRLKFFTLTDAFPSKT